MKAPQSKVSVLALRRLLIQLKEHRPDICFRYRLIGQMWADGFMRVSRISEHGVQLTDEGNHQLVIIPDLAQVMQFELDKSFQSYQPYFHYEVVTTGEW